MSIAIMSILALAMGSMVMMATSALPNENDAATAMIQAGSATARFADDVRYAIDVVTTSPTGVEFHVPDRTGDNLPETIRYSWSGTAGDPFVRTLNGDRHEILLEQVNSVAFTYKLTPSTLPPRVMLVVPDAASLGADDQRRRELMRGWGFQVEPISAGASKTEIDALATRCDVVYISEEANANDVGNKLTDLAIGVVNEEGGLHNELGISNSPAALSENAIYISDNSHPITEGFGTGGMAITSSNEPLVFISSGASADLRVLANVRIVTLGLLGIVLATDYEPTLGVIEEGGDLVGTSLDAPARRVMLPFGASGFTINSLNANGVEIMRRSILWAGQRDVALWIDLEIGAGAGSDATARRRVVLANQPGGP